MRRETSQLDFFIFFLQLLGFLFTDMAIAQNTTIPVNFGVVLDMDERVGRMGLSCISMALSDFYDSHAHYKTRLVPNIRDSNNSVVDAAAAALDLLKNVQVKAIIGPLTSMQTNFVINLGENAQVPIISFSAASPALSSLRSSYFIRATVNDSSQVKALTAIVGAFGWRQAVPVYVDNEFGQAIIPFLTDALQEIDARVPYRSAIHPSANDDELVEELYKLMTMQTRVFIVHMPAPLGSRLFNKAKEIGMMTEGYVWIITDGITNYLSMMDHSVIDSMQGVLGVKPHVPRRKRLEDFRVRWKKKSQEVNLPDIGLNIFGFWAYDAATALAIAVEKLHAVNSSFQVGKDLGEILSSIRFRGLSGDFHIVNGKLQSSAFQIVNIIGEGERGIGFWTPENGIVKDLNMTNIELRKTSKANLKAIVWPGDITTVPKGWVIPANGKKLRIGVPVNDDYGHFVKITRNNSSNTTNCTGYSIEVFDTVMAMLPYHVSYEFIPFAKPDGKSAGNYDDLVYQVFLGNFDAVVGDVTIIANRSLYVDFTLPYTESGVTMIVPLIDKKQKNAWVFLKPLTWELWLTSACFFFFVGFVIWILEHQMNEVFNGTRPHQLGTCFWFSFSTMVFEQKEKVVSNLARFVVIIWCFVVLILTQSYTASLTSMLTVQQLEPTINSVHELVEKGITVGYPKGSFVLALLENLHVDKSKIKVYNSTNELHTAFTKGTIKAAFDEIPYMKLFLGDHCSKYTMVEPIIHKTDGFGFVFPMGSPLVADISRAILNLTQGDKMVGIEKEWLSPDRSCPDPTTFMSSQSLGLGSFWGLFLIVGVASSFALIIFTAMLLYEHKYFLMHLDPKALWRKMMVMFRGHKKSKHDDRNGIDTSCELSHSSIAIPT